MNVYSFEVVLHATLYVKAENKAEALLLATSAADGAVIEVNHASGDIEVSGRMYSDPELPEVSLTPAMSVGAVNPLGDFVEKIDGDGSLNEDEED